jgi:purine-binding chemotaxis protein CheW
MDKNSSDFKDNPPTVNGSSWDRNSDSRIDISKMLQELREDFKRGFYPEDSPDSEQTLTQPRIEVLTLGLGDQHYAFETKHILEIVKAPRTVSIPSSPSFILGIINLRGEIVSVINLKEFLKSSELQETSTEWVVIIRDGAVSTGIRVDSVDRILQLPRSALKPPPAALPGVRTELIEGQFNLDNSLLILLSVPAIISCRDLKIS